MSAPKSSPPRPVAPDGLGNFERRWFHYGANACRNGWGWRDPGFTPHVMKTVRPAWQQGFDAQAFLSREHRASAATGASATAAPSPEEVPKGR